MAFTFFFSLAVFAYFHAIKAQKGWTYIVAGIMLVLAIATKYNGFQPILIATIFVPFVHFIPAGNRNRPFAEKLSRVIRAILHTFSGLWLSTIPAIIFVVLFLAFLGKPFEINDVKSMFGALGDLIPRVAEGLVYFMQRVYPLKTVVVGTQLFITVNFYSSALTHFIAAPILLLSLIGAIRGLVKRNAATILLVVWFSFIFAYFASVPAGFVRVILPAAVPISILSASGLVWVLSRLDRYLAKLRKTVLRRRGFRMLVKLGLVLIVLPVNLLYSAPAITNTHSAYRIAAEFIAKNVPDGKLIWWATQPVLITELYLIGRNYRFSDNVTQLDQANIVVLDFRAQLYPEYPIVLSQISHMQLVFTVRNDVPVVNLLDSFSFSQLDQVLANKDTMSIKIYSRTPMNPQLSAEFLSTLQVRSASNGWEYTSLLVNIRSFSQTQSALEFGCSGKLFPYDQ